MDEDKDENFCPSCVARMDASISECPHCSSQVIPYKKRITRLADYQRLANIDDTPAPGARIENTF